MVNFLLQKSPDIKDYLYFNLFTFNCSHLTFLS